MSFSAIRSAASSALSASQVRMQLASANIANADTDGYAVKTATQVTTLSGGQASGVAITAISSNVDKYLLADLVGATSELGAATASDDMAQSLQALLGSTSSDSGSGTSIAQSLADLETAASELADSSSSETLQAALVSALDATANQLNTLSSSIQSLRQDADGQIADAIDTVNVALETIAELNTKIVAAKGAGDSTADLEDQRNTALQQVAQYIDVEYYVSSSGMMRVSTSDGTTLADSSAREIQYSAAGTVNADTTFSAISVGGKDISSEIEGGAIGALLTARDETLVAAQDELDELAANLIAGVNAVADVLEGTDARSISVLSDVVDDPSSVASSASALYGALTGTVDFDAAGTIAAGSRTLADYATLIVGKVATAASAASAKLDSAETAQSTLQSEMDSASGVNLDEETAKLSELEQYYAVAAQILTTLNAMFDSLLETVQ